MTAYVLYDNVFNQAGATVTYLGEVDSSGPFAHDMLLYDRWIHGKSTGTANIEVTLSASYEINSWAIFGHNLGSNGSIVSLLRYDSGAWSTEDIVIPTDDKPIFRVITPVSGTAFRVVISWPAATEEIYHVCIGKSLTLKPLNTGFAPPMYEQFSANNSVNNHGVLLGRSASKAARSLSIKQSAITTAELYSNYKAWLDFAVKYPFLFCWNYESYPGDTVFCWLDDMGPDPVYSHLCHLSIDMKVKAMLWHEVPST